MNYGLRTDGISGSGAARFFKTRPLAARACELSRIQSNGQPAKAAHATSNVGDLLQIKNEGGDFQVEVLLLSEVRGTCIRCADAVPRDGCQPGVAPEGSRRTPGDDAVRSAAGGQAVET